MGPLTFFLLLSEALALNQTWTGRHHSLRYVHTAVSRPGTEPWFIGLGYVDDTAFVRFESHSDDGNSRSEPLVPWMQGMEQRYWDQETWTNRKIAQAFRENLRILPAHNNQNESVGEGADLKVLGAESHTYQGFCGCDLSSNGSIKQYVQQAYHGEDFFSVNEEMSWTYRDPTAWTTLRRSSDTFKKEDWKACLVKDQCKHWLLTYLEKGKKTLQCTDLPKISLTHHHISEHSIRLKCWALGFCPSEITLIWKRDGENLIPEMELVETRPAGDGTFQKWAAVVVPRGEEQRYTCHVQHEALPEPLTRRWELPNTSNRGIATGLSVLGAVVLGVVVLGKLWWLEL